MVLYSLELHPLRLRGLECRSLGARSTGATGTNSAPRPINCCRRKTNRRFVALSHEGESVSALRRLLNLRLTDLPRTRRSGYESASMCETEAQFSPTGRAVRSAVSFEQAGGLVHAEAVRSHAAAAEVKDRYAYNIPRGQPILQNTPIFSSYVTNDTGDKLTISLTTPTPGDKRQDSNQRRQRIVVHVQQEH